MISTHSVICKAIGSYLASFKHKTVEIIKKIICLLIQVISEIYV